MYTYRVTTCDILNASDNNMDRYDAYHHDHTDDVHEGIVLNVQPIPPSDESYEDLPF